MSASQRTARPHKRDGLWYLVRRVPAQYAALDRRGIVRVTTAIRICGHVMGALDEFDREPTGERTRADMAPNTAIRKMCANKLSVPMSTLRRAVGSATKIGAGCEGIIGLCQ